MHQVFGWAADREGCAYYRLGLPFEHLRAAGHDATEDTVLPDAVLAGEHILVGQRLHSLRFVRIWRDLAAAGRRLVYEIDDDLWALEQDNPGWFYFHQPEVRGYLTECCATAGLVTVSTEQLADVVRQHTDRVAVLPNCVPAAMLDRPAPDYHRDGPLTIAWQGSVTHGADWSVVRPWLHDLAEVEPDVRFRVYGANYAEHTRLADRSEFIDWISGVPAYHAALSADIMIAPLLDTPFNASKSHIRVLEAAALGIPTVASPVPPYAGFITDGTTGLLADGDQWLHTLRALIHDPDLREKIGTGARRRAADFTAEGNAHRWADAYDTLPT